MPKTILDKYRRQPPAPRPNYLAEYLRSCRKASKLTSDMIAEHTREYPSTVRRKMVQEPEKWQIGDLKRYCEILGASYPEALRLAGESSGN